MKFANAATVFLFLLSSGCFSQFTLNPQEPERKVVVNPEPPPDPEIDRVVSVVNTVETKNNYIDQLNPDSNVSLPFGIIKQIGAARYVVAIDSVKFLPQGAYFSAYAAIDFPGTLRKLAFRASHVKFNPKGVIGGEQAKLYLVSDHVIRINSTVSLKLRGNGQNWVEWDCNGFKKINLVGNFVFKKGTLLPDPAQTSDSVVTASFQIYTENIHDFITNVNITPFKINGLDDWAFKVTNAIADMSELSNAPTMIFPVGYQNPNNVTPQMWKGFALQSLSVKLPRELSKIGKSTEVYIKDLLIDNMGLTGLFQINNIFNTSEGSMDGWDFSLDELGVGFICNQLSSGHLKGTVNIPITDSAQTLQYNADVNYNPLTKNVSYNFVLRPQSELRFKVFSANVTLSNNSNISVTKVNGMFKPVASLNGFMSFDNTKFNSNGGQLLFQNLVISTQAPYITNGVFTIHNINGGQIKTNFYPVSVDDITFGVNQGAPILGFNVRLNFSDLANNALTVGTSILLKGKIETRSQLYPGEARGGGTYVTKTKWSFDRVILNAVNVDVETAPLVLKGTITYRDNDPLYGSGFFGMLDLSIKKIIEEPIAINVGFGSKEDYKYFFLDARIPAKYILPTTPLGLSRIIGGIYYHMRPSKISEVDLIALNQNFNNIIGNALTYVPTPSIALGLKMGVSADFIQSESLCNGDLFLDVNFTNAGGLGAINLTGNIYSMATIANKVNAPVRGRMVMSFDPESKTLDALAQVNISFYQIINGNGYLKAHFDPQTWYLCIGKPSAPNNVRFLNLAEAPSYFMTGSSIEPSLQPPASFSAQRNQPELQSGRGFCAGARIHSGLNRSFGFSFFNVDANYNFDLGFDLMMANYGEKATCSGTDEKVGLNGRLAQGDMYLDMSGAVTINGHFKFPSDCPSSYEICVLGICGTVNVPCIVNANFSYTVFSADVNAKVYAKVPKPLYFDGTLNCDYTILNRVTGNFAFDYSYGNNCNPISN